MDTNFKSEEEENSSSEEIGLTGEDVRMAVLRLALLAMRFERTAGNLEDYPNESQVEATQRVFFAEKERIRLKKIIGILGEIYNIEQNRIQDEMWVQMHPWLSRRVGELSNALDFEAALKKAGDDFSAEFQNRYGKQVKPDSLQDTVREMLGPLNEYENYKKMNLHEQFKQCVKDDRGKVQATKKILTGMNKKNPDIGRSISEGTINNYINRAKEHGPLEITLGKHIDSILSEMKDENAPDDLESLRTYLTKLIEEITPPVTNEMK
ncbi:MAG: hypothetical protein GY847_25325 [Proteobacteria bacterium]|nr:hypothetical protein [Pseudomonadota bacterium]